MNARAEVPQGSITPQGHEADRLYLPVNQLINPFTGLAMHASEGSMDAIHPLPAAMVAGRAVFPDGMKTGMSRRGLFGRAATLGFAAVGISRLHPSEASADGGSENPLANLPPVDPTPEAGQLMESSFADQAKVIKENKAKLLNATPESFHRYFGNNRSEIYNAMQLGLTPGEFTTDLAGALSGVDGPYYYPAFMQSVEEYQSANSFGRVSLYSLGLGQELTNRTLVGGVIDAVVLGMTFHNYGDSKIVVVHYGGMHEEEVWTSPGYGGYISKDGKYLSPASTFSVDSGDNQAERVFPYDIPGKPRYSQRLQAGINELINSIDQKGGGSFSVGMTVGLDYLKKITGAETLASLNPDFTSDDYVLAQAGVGANLMEYLQLHGANAMLKKMESTVQQMGLVGYGSNSKTVMGRDGILQLFPNADKPDTWPKVRSSGYFLSEKREEITLDDLKQLPNIGMRRMFYPRSGDQAYAEMSSTLQTS